MPTWVQHPETGKLIPKHEYVAPESNAPWVHGDIQDFVSPITKEVISDRGQLRRHNATHGVTNSSDYSGDFMAKRSKARDDRMTGNNLTARAERREALNRALIKGGF